MKNSQMMVTLERKYIGGIDRTVLTSMIDGKMECVIDFSTKPTSIKKDFHLILSPICSHAYTFHLYRFIQDHLKMDDGDKITYRPLVLVMGKNIPTEEAICIILDFIGICKSYNIQLKIAANPPESRIGYVPDGYYVYHFDKENKDED